MAKVPLTVFGAGAWGLALAAALQRNDHPVCVWLRDGARCAQLAQTHRDARYLPDMVLPEDLHFTADLSLACAFASHWLLVVPNRAFAPLLQQLWAYSRPVTMAWATKGLDPETQQLLHERYLALPSPLPPYAVISGPSFAREVALGLPAALTVAAPEASVAQAWARIVSGGPLRAYVSADVIGVELGGAAKNVLAIAAGIADGLQYGANARAALITRGLAEIMRLGKVMGANPETLMGLAGLGDLILTCTDDQSRNRRLGLLLAQGLTLAQAQAQIGQAIEGVATAKAIWGLAQRHQLDLPICSQTYQVLYQNQDPHTAVQQLLKRALTQEYPHG